MLDSTAEAGWICNLSDFLKKRLSRHGDRTSLARRLQVREATVTRWFTGKTTPPFDKCVMIAEYLDVDPRHIFRMAGRVDFVSLFDRTFPDFQKPSLSEEDLYNNDDHCKLHRRVQALLDTGRLPKVAAYVRQLEEQRALSESEHLFRRIFEQNPLATTITSASYQLIQINRAFCRILGYSQRELATVKLPDILFSSDVERTVADLDGLLTGRDSCYRTRRRYLRRDGSPVCMSLTGCAILDE